MFKLYDINRFVLDEFKTKEVQQQGALVVKLYNKKAPKKFKHYCMWACRKCINRSLKSFLNLGLINRDDTDVTKFFLSNLAKDIINPTTQGTVDKDRLLEWSYMVGDKQYFLYSWNDAKVSSLITVDAALMAGILFVLQLLDFSSPNIQSGTEEHGLFLGIFPLIFLLFHLFY